MTEDEVRRRNEGAPWSGPDLFELQSSVARGDLIEETAALLKRRNGEVREKIQELRSKDGFAPHASGEPKGPATDEGVELAYRDSVERRARQSRERRGMLQ